MFFLIFSFKCFFKGKRWKTHGVRLQSLLVVGEEELLATVPSAAVQGMAPQLLGAG